MKHFHIILLPLFTMLFCNSFGQEVTSITHSDTLYFVQKSNGKLKPTPQNRASRYIVESIQNKEITERKLYHLKTDKLLKHYSFKDGRPAGKWQYLNDDGEVVRERDFEKLQYEPCTKQDSATDENITLPKFGNKDSDLLKYLRENIMYPAESKDNGTQGFVYINFIVDKTGRAIPDHICDSGLDGYTDLVVWEMVENMPLWTPGTLDGENIEVLYTLPTLFKLR